MKKSILALALMISGGAMMAQADELVEAPIGYSESTASYVLQLSNEYAYNYMPYMRNDTDPRYDTFTYSSSNEEVATVNPYGQVLPLAEGTTTITCAWEANEQYLAGSTSYELTVLPMGTLFYSATGSGFTFDEAWEMTDGGLATKGEDAGTAISKEFTVPETGNATVSFNTVNAGEGCTVAVRTAPVIHWSGTVEAEAGEWVVLVTEGLETATAAIPDDFNGKSVQLGFTKPAAAVDPAWTVSNVVIVAIDPLIAAKKAALAEIEKYYALTKQNQSVASGYAYQLENAGNEDAIKAIVAEAINQLAEYVMNEINGGFIWTAGQGFVIVEDGAGVVAPQFSTDAVWSAEPAAAPSWGYMSADGDAAAAEPSKYSFYLSNVASGLYLAINADGKVTIADSKETAGLFRIVAQDYTINLANDAQPTQFVAVADGGFTITDATGKFGYERPDYTNDQIYISTEGLTFNDWGSPNPIDQLSVITLNVPVNAEFTGLGELFVAYDESDPQTYTNTRVVLEKWTAEQIQAMAPEETVYTTKVWDYDTWQQIEKEIPCLSYTFALKNAITSPNYYFAQTSDMMFSVKTPEGETAPEIPVFFKAGSLNVQVGDGNPSTGGEINIAVTPEEGDVATLAEITLTNADGIELSINWEGDSDAVIAIYRDEENGEPNVVKTFSKDDMIAALTEKTDYLNDPDVYVLTTGITEDGTYTLAIPDAFFSVEYTDYNEEAYFTWTVKTESGITTITPAATSKAVYDLQGRRMSAPRKGLNIVEGKVVRL